MQQYDLETDCADKNNETKQNSVDKKPFKGTVKIAKIPDPYADCNYLTFKSWDKKGQKRIYIKDYKGRTLGYIEDGNVLIQDQQGSSKEDIDYALNSFKQQYDY